MDRKETGARGELLAQNFLKKKGYRILGKNYRSPYGEVDIVAKVKGVLVFIEVRTKRSKSFGMPEESITPTKTSHLRATAYHYRQTHPGLPENWRIDLIAIDIDAFDKPLRINHIENAVEEE